jgi:hypothetical protein
MARTTSVSYYPTSPGSLNLDTNRPVVFIMDSVPPPILNTDMWKTGRKTGTTFGAVSGTCTDQAEQRAPGDTVWTLCMYRVTAADSLGDSGSPVYQWFSYPDSTVALAGILVLGGDFEQSTSHYWFSPLTQIKAVLRSGWLGVSAIHGRPSVHCGPERGIGSRAVDSVRLDSHSPLRHGTIHVLLVGAL